MIKGKLSKLFDPVFLEKNVSELHTPNFCSRQEPFIFIKPNRSLMGKKK